MAFSFFKKKADVSASSGELKINMPGREKPAVDNKPPMATIPIVADTKAQRSCDDMYANQHNMLICPHCETIFTNKQRQCPACGLHFSSERK